jgi:hypothetical protein
MTSTLGAVYLFLTECKVWWHAATIFIYLFYNNRVDIQCLYILLVEYPLDVLMASAQ